MNLFNRILIILAAFALMAVSLLICLQAIEIIAIEKIGLSLSLNELLRIFGESELQTRLITGGICLGVFLMGAILLIFELRPFIAQEKYFLVNKGDLGKVEISEHSINKFINIEARQFASVDESKSSVKEKGDGFHIKNLITIKPSTNVSEIGKGVQTGIKKSMQEKLGLNVAEVSVQTRLTPAKKTVEATSRLN